MALSDHKNDGLLCRTCLKVLSEGDTDENPKHNIFQTPELAKKLIACAAVELEPSDQYPKHICDCCYNKVNEFFKFRTMCVDSMERLRKLSPSTQDEEPMFDLGSIVKMEIVVGEHEVMFQDDADTVRGGAETRKRRSGRLIVEKKMHEAAAATDVDSTTSGKRVKSRIRMKKAKVEDEKQTMEKNELDDEASGDGKLPIKVELADDVDSTSSELHCDEEKDRLPVKNDERIKVNNNKKGSKQPKGKIFRCDTCSAQFATEALFVAHKHTHETYVCDICGQQTRTLQNLKVHINYHTEHICQLCSRICSSAEKLRIHVRTVHEGIKKYACRYCDRKFGRWHTRKCHEMTHTGERPHKCGQCGKCFTQRGALKTHLKMHTRDNVPLEM